MGRRLVAEVGGIPVVKAETEVSRPIAVKRLSQSRYLVTRSDPDGTVLSSFRVEGEPFNTSPLFAAINFLIFPDWYAGYTLLPFLGGTPAE